MPCRWQAKVQHLFSPVAETARSYADFRTVWLLGGREPRRCTNGNFYRSIDYVCVMAVYREMKLWGGLLDDLKHDLQKGINREYSFVASYLQVSFASLTVICSALYATQERTDAGFPLDLPGLGLTSASEGSWMKDIFLTYAGAAILEAGSETVATAIETFLLFMLANPRCYERVRMDIDKIVGDQRMPCFEDEDRLPYLKACIKESARLRPVAILGMLAPFYTGFILKKVVLGSPHSCESDQIVNGYLIPKHSVILGNVFTIHRDPERYPDPDVFFPERFMEGPNAGKWASGPEKDRDHYLFGWGRVTGPPAQSTRY